MSNVACDGFMQLETYTGAAGTKARHGEAVVTCVGTGGSAGSLGWLRNVVNSS